MMSRVVSHYTNMNHDVRSDDKRQGSNHSPFVCHSLVPQTKYFVFFDEMFFFYYVIDIYMTSEKKR